MLRPAKSACLFEKLAKSFGRVISPIEIHQMRYHCEIIAIYVCILYIYRERERYWISVQNGSKLQYIKFGHVLLSKQLFGDWIMFRFSWNYRLLSLQFLFWLVELLCSLVEKSALPVARPRRIPAGQSLAPVIFPFGHCSANIGVPMEPHILARLYRTLW